jgi:hypothetical protein
VSILQKIGGIAAISEAVIYIFAFIFFGVYWHYPNNESTLIQLSYLAETQLIYSTVNMMMYVFFGIMLSLITVALYERLKSKSPVIMQVATIFGVIWVTLVIASGMISTVGLKTIIAMSSSDPERALTVWATISAIVQGIGGGNEVIGGLWVLLLSIAAVKSNEPYKTFNYFGLLVGTAGILTIYPAEELTAIFGISQIIWFFGLGFIMLKNTNENVA